MKKVRATPDTGTRHLAGLMTHLAFLSSYFMGIERPRATSVRVEGEIHDYVEKILEIRQRAEDEGMHNYLEAEKSLLFACKGKLPPTIQLRASYSYRHSPSVKLAELRYSEPIFDHPLGRKTSQALTEYKEATGGGPADFVERLKPSERAAWDSFVEREEKNRVELEERIRQGRERVQPGTEA